MVSFPQKVFMVMTQKENLMKDRLARKTTQTEQRRKLIKEYRVEKPSQSHIKNIAKGTTDPRVEFILPK